MVDGDAVKPRAQGGLAAELVQLAECLQEHIMRGILGLLRVAEKTQRQIINRAAIFLIKTGKFRRAPDRLATLCHGFTSCGWLAHESFHCPLDKVRPLNVTLARCSSDDGIGAAVGGANARAGGLVSNLSRQTL